MTTIQVTPEFKKYLESLKESPKQTYQDVIEKALKKSYPKKLTPQEELLKEGYLAMAQENKKISEEFKDIDAENFPDEEWNIKK